MAYENQSQKSNVVHFRPPSYVKTSHEFKYGNEDILTVSRYKYLGIILDEFLDFNTTASILADSAGRALGNIFSKYKMNKCFGYDTHTKLYMSGVTPIMDYCSGVWGYNALDKLDTIQNTEDDIHFLSRSNATLYWTQHNSEVYFQLIRDTHILSVHELWDDFVSVCVPEKYNREISRVACISHSQIFSVTQDKRLPPTRCQAIVIIKC